MGSVTCAKLRSHLHIVANGERQLCCNAVYKPDGFTDEEVRLLAERADAGVGNKWCVRCYQTEAMGVSSALKTSDIDKRKLKVALSLASWQITAFSRQYIQTLLESKVLFASIDHGQK